MYALVFNRGGFFLKLITKVLQDISPLLYHLFNHSHPSIKAFFDVLSNRYTG